jgi:hypothetical protein
MSDADPVGMTLILWVYGRRWILRASVMPPMTAMTKTSGLCRVLSAQLGPTDKISCRTPCGVPAPRMPVCPAVAERVPESVRSGCGPRPDAARLTGTTWPVTSQSNKWRTAWPTMPSADSCVAVGSPRGSLSSEIGTRHRPPQVSSIAFPAPLPDLQPWPLMDMDFAISRPLVRPEMPDIRFLFVRPRFCSTLQADSSRWWRPGGDARIS